MSTKFELATDFPSLHPYVVKIVVPQPNMQAGGRWEIEGLLEGNMTVSSNASLESNDGNLMHMQKAAEETASKWTNSLVNKLPGWARPTAEAGMQAAGNMAAGAISNATGGQFQFGWKSLATTFMKYASSSQGGFPISFKIFPDKHGSYTETTEKIYKLSAPFIAAKGFNASMASYLYDPGQLAQSVPNPFHFDDQLIHVFIGDWFYAKGLFCTSSSVSMSPYLDNDGRPVYADVQLNFQHHRVLDARELAAWFLK